MTDELLEERAKRAYERYWKGLSAPGKGTPWWHLHEDHRERWRGVVRAVVKTHSRKRRPECPTSPTTSATP